MLFPTTFITKKQKKSLYLFSTKGVFVSKVLENAEICIPKLTFSKILSIPCTQVKDRFQHSTINLNTFIICIHMWKIFNSRLYLPNFYSEGEEKKKKALFAPPPRLRTYLQLIFLDFFYAFPKWLGAVIVNERIIKGKTHKKIRFLVVGPLRGGGALNPLNH